VRPDPVDRLRHARLSVRLPVGQRQAAVQRRRCEHAPIPAKFVRHELRQRRQRPLVLGCNWATPSGNPDIEDDGFFSPSKSYKIVDIADGLSKTIAVGEFSRFVGDPEPLFNFWNRAAWFSAPNQCPGCTRVQGFAYTVPKLNASVAVVEPASTLSPTGNPDSWLYDPATLNFGQFGFHSLHDGGAHFLMGDGSVHFFNNSIDAETPTFPSKHFGVYRSLSTRASGETDATVP